MGKILNSAETSKTNNSVANQRPGTRSKKSLFVGMGIALVVGAVGGTVLGINIADPSESSEYIALSNELTATQAEVAEVKGNIDEREASVVTRGNELDTRSGELDSLSADLKKREISIKSDSDLVLEREKAVGLVEEEQKANSIDDGIYTVEVDIAAGTYRANAEVEANCFWAITKSGGNGDQVISANSPGGGRPSVTVKKGQDFQLIGCGTWVKQK